jgi:hypothetical protein
VDVPEQRSRSRCSDSWASARADQEGRRPHRLIGKAERWCEKVGAMVEDLDRALPTPRQRALPGTLGFGTPVPQAAPADVAV